MGGGSWSSRAYQDHRDAQQATGADPFAHTSRMFSLQPDQRCVNPLVNPTKKNGLGQIVRECLDTDEHPETTAVVVGFDETGSMGDVPRELQTRLATLYGVLLRHGYVSDPQIAFAAYGDGLIGETAPVQCGQFESDLRALEALEALYLEGCGGGNGGESPGLLLHFLGTRSKLDSLAKRGKKGYLFLTGDEKPHKLVTRQEIKQYLGEDVEADLTIEQVVARARESYEVYFLLINNWSAQQQGSQRAWSQLLGQDHVVVLENPNTVTEVIALILGHAEGVLTDAGDGLDHLRQAGADERSLVLAADAVTRTLGSRSNAVATATGNLPVATNRHTTRRL